MSAQRQTRSDPPGREPVQDDAWVRVPAVVDVNGDKVVTLYDERGRPQTRLLAELILEAFVGPRPPGSVVRFKDGNRLNCDATNLEWVAVPATRDEAARRGPERACDPRAGRRNAPDTQRPHTQ